MATNNLFVLFVLMHSRASSMRWRAWFSLHVIASLVVSLFAPALPFLVPAAQAAATITVTSSGLQNASFSGVPVSPAAGAPIVLMKLQVTASASATLNSLRLIFGGTGFTTSDLAPLSDAFGSGVSIMEDSAAPFGSPTMADTFITPTSTIAWVPASTTLDFVPVTPVSLSSGVMKTFFVIANLNPAAVNGHRVNATVPVGGIDTTDGAGPATAFTANDYLIDAQPPMIVAFEGSVGSPTTTVRFNEPVFSASRDRLQVGDNPLVYSDGGGAQAISNIVHVAGQDVATVVLDNPITSDDLATPARISVATSTVQDGVQNVATSTVRAPLTDPLRFTTTVVPTASASTTYSGAAPLVTFAGAGGTAPYSFTPADLTASSTLSGLGLRIVASNGKLTGTTGSSAGSFGIPVRITDAVNASSVRVFTINIAGAGGSVPGISMVTPGGGPQGGSVSVSVTGSNTSFSGSSAVSFLMPIGAGGTNGVTAGSAAASDPTHLSFTVSIALGASAGPRDLQIVTGGQSVTLPNAFTVFESAGSGLQALLPTNDATGVPMPPAFTFQQSSNGSIVSYRIKVRTTYDPDDATMPIWDYAFTKTASMDTSHCNASQCTVPYAAGTYRILTPPTPLIPGNNYYWQVFSYATSVNAVSAVGVSPVERTEVRRFQTTASVTDTTPPNVFHRPVFRAEESHALSLYVKVLDNIASEATSPALSVNVLHCQGGGCTPTTSQVCSFAAAGYYRCDIPSGAGGIGAAGAITRYKIRASDGVNTVVFQQPDGSPFQLTAVTAGAGSISGSVQEGGSCTGPMSGALVIAEGTGFAAMVDGSCNFSLTGLPAGTYDVTAVQTGYGERHADGIPVGTTGLALSLTSGLSGGFGGDTTRPTVRATCPIDGSRNLPGGDSNFKICVVFSKAMNQTTVNTAGNLSVRILDPGAGTATDITTARGSWTYYPTSPGVPGLPPDANVAVWSFNPGQMFGDDRTIAVRVSADVTDTSGNSIQGNQPDGSYAFSFTTGRVFSGGFSGGETFGSGAFIPPRVVGSSPAPGAFGVPRNIVATVNFSDAMADDAAGYTLRGCLKLFPVSDTGETSILTSATLDSSKRIATLSFPTLLASSSYRLKVLGSCRASSGLTLGPPGSSATQTMYVADFRTGSTSDTTPPTIVGSFPDQGASNVPVGVGSVGVAFSRDMNPSTITANSVYLSVGSTVVNATVEWRPLERRAIIIPRSALSPDTTYTLNVTTDVIALNGQALATAAARTFTTGAADATVPQIRYMTADDHAISVTFSEPMNAATLLDATNWPRSVVNPDAYNVIKFGAPGFNPAVAGTVVSLSGARFSYDPIEHTVLIEGLDLTSAVGQELYLSMDASGSNQTKDLSGNLLDSGAASVRAPVRSSASTGGALGPGALSTSAFAGAGFVASNISTSTFATFGQIEARPNAPLTGATSKYFLKIPLSRQIVAPGKIVITFPAGFSTAGAQQDIASPSRQDINGPGPGTITFKCLTNVAGGKSCTGGANSDDTGDAQGGLADDGVVVGDRTVTVYLSASTNSGGYDFLNIDLDGITNSSIPLDFSTSGYTVDIKTFSGSSLLESLTSRPFFLQAAGSQTVSGTLTLPGNDQTCSVNVYLNSPIGGTQRVSASFTGGTTAAYSFSGVSSGDAMISTDRFVSCGVGGTAKNYSGRAIPERLFVPAAGPVVYNFSLTSADTGGTAVSVAVSGGVGKRLDLFAGSPSNFVVRQITPSSDPETFTLRVTDGTYFLGVGPTMEAGTMGPPPATDYVIPRPKELRVQGGGCTIDGTTGCTTSVSLTSASKTIKGIVKDTNNRLMANVEVFAYAPGGFGARAQTNSDGIFSLPVVPGTYTVAANSSGLRSRESNVRVSSDGSAYLFIDGATTGITPTAASSDFVLKIAKPDCSISGRVTDGSNVVQNAGVFAHRTDAPGQVNAMTDSTGNYSLPVDCSGSWQVQAFSPGYGQMAAQTVNMSAGSQSNINFSPSLVGTFYTVSGQVTASGSPVQGAIVRISNASNFNEAVTDSDGNYSVRVPAGSSYTIRAFIPGRGDSAPLAPFTVSADTAGKNISFGTMRTVTMNFSSVMPEAFIDLVASDGRSNHIDVRNGTTTSVLVPDGSYEVRIGTPGLPLGRSTVSALTGATVYNNTTGIVTVNGDEGLVVTLPTLRTVSGTVTDGSSPLGDAWVELANVSSNAVVGMRADSSGTFSLKVPDGTYRLNAMKPGYLRVPTDLTVSADLAGQTVAMSQSSLAISGTIRIGSAGAANAFVRAERLGGGFTATQADATGAYRLPVTDGSWRVYAVANGYAEQAYASNPLDVSGSSLTGKDITLTTASSFSISDPGSQPISTSNGGTIQDTDAGIRLVVPPNAVSSDGSDAILSYTETTNLPDTPSAHPLEAGFEFSAAGSNGNQLNNFNDAITVEMTYTPAELRTQTARDGSALDTWAEVRDELQLGTFDASANAWDPLATTVTCKDADGNPVADPASLSSCSGGVTIAASAEHFSLYAPIIATDPAAPSTPSGFSGTAASVSSIDLSWSVVSGATSYDIYRSDSLGGTYSRLGSEPTVSSGATLSYTDTGLSAGTTYYYKITAINGSGESEGSAPITVSTRSAASGGSGGGGGGMAGGSVSSGQSVFSLGQTTPTTPARVTTTPSVPPSTPPIVVGPLPPSVPVVSQPLPSAPAPTTAAPVTSKPLIGPPAPLSTVKAEVGKKLAYAYAYRNAGKTSQKVHIERLILDERGKIVKRAFADLALKPGQEWKGSVNDTVPGTWKPGTYRMTITMTDTKTKKQLQQKTISVTVQAPTPKLKTKPSAPTKPTAKKPVIKKK